MPLGAYRHGAGWPLGRTLLEFVHTGRKTGRPYQTVAMVLRHDADAHNAVICAGWDPGRLRLISTILGWGDLRDDAAVRGFIRTHPFVAFRPATTSPT